MRVSLPILGLVLLTLAPTAEAQRPTQAGAPDGLGQRPMSLRRPGGLRNSTDRRASRLASRLDPSRPDIYGRARFLGYRTRVDQIRNMIPYRRHGTRLVRSESGPSSPASILLNRRNLLSARSVLGSESWTLLGRQYYRKDDQGRWLGEVAADVEPAEALRRLQAVTETTVPSYEDRLEARLGRKADEYYRLGLFFFQQGKYRKAGEFFDLVRQLEPDKARGYVAGVLVSYQRRDVASAHSSLVLALDEKRSKSLSDLWVDPLRFYAKRRAFQTTFKQLSRDAESARSSTGMQLLFSYYAWLNGDMSTAIGSARTAEAGLEAEISRQAKARGRFVHKDRASYAKRFREMLIEARDKKVTADTKQ